MANDVEWVAEALQKVYGKVGRTNMKIGANFPHASVNGSYQLEEPHWWTAGFWPGLLWLLYRETKDESLKETAKQCEKQLDSVITDYYKLDHDIGFMWTLTSVASYKLTKDEDSKRRALLAANLLAARFNCKGNYICAWNSRYKGDENTGWAIIDCLMNLPLLFWATQETGDPRFCHVAKKHGETALNHFIRKDGSVHHIVQFNPETGEKEKALGGQGFSSDSAWSRGASWAIYGLALLYRYTGESQYLHAAKGVAHFFIAHLPDDFVPYWDFRLPQGIPNYRDSSAGSIAACGLLAISQSVERAEANIYKQTAIKMLRSLNDHYGDWENDAQDGLILHGTSHYPEGKNIDVPLIYGDYFFVEGLTSLKAEYELFW